MRKYLFAITFLNISATFSQDIDNGLSKKHGLVVFEDRYDMYFIETSKTNFTALLNTDFDTISAYMLYTSDGVYNFKNYLEQNTILDSATLFIKQDYQIGRFVMDTTLVSWKFGYIEYYKEQSYKLEKRYKTLYYNGKTLIIVLEDYLLIEMFTADIIQNKKVNCKGKRYQ